MREGTVYEPAMQEGKRMRLSLDTKNGQLRDNAVGMFLYDNGNYGPLPDKDINGNKVRSIAVCSSNKTVKEDINLKGSRVIKNFSELSDSDYDHYAMGLNFEDVDNFCDNDRKEKLVPYSEIMDKTFKFRYYRDRYGRQYTNAFRNDDSLKDMSSVKALKSIDDKLKKFVNLPKSISQSFLPTEGQLYLAMVNLSVAMDSDYNLMTPGKEITVDKDGSSGVRFSGNGAKASMKAMFSYYLANENNTHISTCSIRALRTIGQTGGTSTSDIIIFHYDEDNCSIDCGREAKDSFRIVPFYAVKSMTGTHDQDDTCIILEWKPIKGSVSEYPEV